MKVSTFVGISDEYGTVFRIPNMFTDLGGVTIDTIATVWTPTSGKKFRLMGGSFSADAAVSVLFEDNVALTFVWRTPILTIDTPYFFDMGPSGYLSTTVDNVLKATGSGAADITGTLYGIEE